MKILLKAATILDKNSPFHKQKKDILIENNLFIEIADRIACPEECKEIQLENLHVSKGWFDSSVSFGEPGYEERETIENGLEVAARSGFTEVAVNSNTLPFIDSKPSVSFLKSEALGKATKLHPIASLTQQSKGEEMAELYDMQKAGAIAFGDYNKPMTSENMMKVALLYAQNFDGLVMSFPHNKKIAGGGIANEGVQSTLLGLKGIPNLAEELQITRDLCILEYTGGKLHIPTISTKKSVALIREAKQKNLQVTCSVTAHHLNLTDTELKDFNANFKVLPPLRTEEDRLALIEGVKDGTIDCITSDHNPIDIENKKVEFNNATYGTIGLESMYQSLENVLDTETIIECLTDKGRNVFGLESPSINTNQPVAISLFSSEGKSKFTEKDILSTSKNAIFENKEVQGKVYGIFANNQLILK
tara:strand:- start:342 stop:1598 length:1257 start_codon:yes stop_codon:yes gene_type:complete